MILLWTIIRNVYDVSSIFIKYLFSNSVISLNFHEFPLLSFRVEEQGA